jgi:RNA polymerase sigma-70 factor, ECF subfamily
MDDCEFEAVVEVVTPDLTDYVRRHGLGEDDAEDLVQEAFARAWLSRRSCRGEPRPWIFGIAKRLLMDRWRARARGALDPLDAQPLSLEVLGA